jgi:hypothetical protein
VLGRINPAVWDAIIPHGPVGPAARVALNPQPLPPKEAMLRASATWRTTSRPPPSSPRRPAASPAASSSEVIDDWCGNTPRPFPWPYPFPFPWPPEPEPHPDWDIGASRVVGALTLAQVASRMEDGPARDALAKGAEQLLDAGLEA